MGKPRSMQGRRELQDAYAAFEAGNIQAALDRFTAISERRKQDAEARYMRGVCALQLGIALEAVTHIEAAISRAPAVPRYHYDLGSAWMALAEYDRAIETFDHMLILSPNHPWGLAGKAEVLRLLGRDEDAWNAMAPALGDRIDDPVLASCVARIAARVGKCEEAVELVADLATDESLPPVRRAPILFPYAACLARLHRDEEAFETWRTANELTHRPFDADAFSSAIDEVIRAWTPQRVASLPRAETDADRVVYIVGMPRSGTSLVEQILASHPDVAGAGELDDVNSLVDRVENRNRIGGLPLLRHPQLLASATVTQSAKRVEAALEAAISGDDAARVTSKTPTDALHLGLVALMFPGARVIHCRRDPMAAGFSCYMQHFGGYNAWAYDLHTIGRFHADLDRLMNHWKDVLDLRFTDAVYESLIEDQEAESRRLVDFLGLPWNDACLRFHESDRVTHTASNAQVRQPIYRDAVAKWKRHEARLTPLRDGLEEGRARS